MKIKITAILIGILTSFTCFAEEEVTSEYGVNDYVQCAVFHRMMAASFSAQYGSGLESLQISETEKLQSFVKHAKKTAELDNPETAEEVFNEEWQYYLREMFDEINRSYKNVSRLKYRYRQRCAKLAETL